MKSLLLIFTLVLTNCAAHKVTIGDMTVYGNNEQPIPEPTRQ